MNNSSLRTVIQSFVAAESVGPSTLRGQGAKGMIRTSREYLSVLDLGRFSTTNSRVFAKELDQATEELCTSYPRGGRHWGSARKPLNIFLRNAFYNQFLCDHIGLRKSARFFEVPLDSIVAGQIRLLDKCGTLPRWPGVKNLDARTSAEYQAFLGRLARHHHLHRVHLDVFLWQRFVGDLVSGWS